MTPDPNARISPISLESAPEPAKKHALRGP